MEMLLPPSSSLSHPQLQLTLHILKMADLLSVPWAICEFLHHFLALAQLISSAWNLLSLLLSQENAFILQVSNEGILSL